nr:MAG TPA: BetR domain protein [Caudoviricetes sp.]
MREQQLTYKDIGNILNVSKQSVYRRLHGQANWTLREIIVLCQYFNTDIEHLFQNYE